MFFKLLFNTNVYTVIFVSWFFSHFYTFKLNSPKRVYLFKNIMKEKENFSQIKIHQLTKGDEYKTWGNISL